MTALCARASPARNPLTKFCRSFANARNFAAASHREAATGCPMQTFQSLLAKRLSDALPRAGLPEAGELTQATIRALAINRPTFLSYLANNGVKIRARWAKR